METSRQGMSRERGHLGHCSEVESGRSKAGPEQVEAIMRAWEKLGQREEPGLSAGAASVQARQQDSNCVVVMELDCHVLNADRHREGT